MRRHTENANHLLFYIMVIIHLVYALTTIKMLANIGTRKEGLSSGLTEHFILSQLARIKAGKLLQLLAKFYIK